MKLPYSIIATLAFSLAVRTYTMAQCSFDMPIVKDLAVCGLEDIPPLSPENTPANAQVRWYDADNTFIGEGHALTLVESSGTFFCSFSDGACETEKKQFTVKNIKPTRPHLNYEYLDPSDHLPWIISATCDGTYDRFVWTLPDGTKSVGNTIDAKYIEENAESNFIVSVIAEYTQNGLTCSSDTAYDIFSACSRPPIVHAPLYYPADKPLRLTAQVDDQVAGVLLGEIFIVWEIEGKNYFGDTVQLSFPQGKHTVRVRQYCPKTAMYSPYRIYDILFGYGYPTVSKTEYQALLGAPNPPMDVIISQGTSVQWRDSSGRVVSTDASFTSPESAAGTYQYYLYYSVDNTAFLPLKKIELTIYKGITGYAYHDRNLNNTKDADEEGLPGQIVRLSNSNTAITDRDGRFFFQASSGRYKLSTFLQYPYKPIGEMYTREPDNTVSAINYIDLRAANYISIDLPFTTYTSASDMSVSLDGTFARPGFATKLWLTYTNTGAESAPSQLRLEYDSTLIFENASSAPSVHIGNTLLWDLPAVCNACMGRIELGFRVPADIALLGDTLKSVATIGCAKDETACSNNAAVVQTRITGSYDPNELEAKPSYGKRCVVPMDSSITYTVRFQNEGTDTAFTVVVMDTISSLLNLSTFKLIASSHPVDVAMRGHVLYFTFNDIGLPDKKTNEIGSMGFVKFSIDPTYMESNTLVSNNADIYFDFNPPIVTNTYQSLYYEGVFDDTTDIVTTRIITDTLFAGMSVYIYSPMYYSNYCEIISVSANAGKTAFHHEDLMPEYFYYKPQAGFAGKDTILLKTMSDNMGRLPDTLMMIFTVVPFQFEQDIDIPVQLITSWCKDDEMPYNKYEISGDSIYFSGIVSANCCAQRIIYARYEGDSITVRFDFKYGGCTCTCNYGYSFALPVQSDDITVRYDGSVGVETDEPVRAVLITPNPSNGLIQINSDIEFDSIRIYSVDGTLVAEKYGSNSFDLTHLPHGIYRAACMKKGVPVATSDFVISEQ